jgi:hypothetical protein
MTLDREFLAKLVLATTVAFLIGTAVTWLT